MAFLGLDNRWSALHVRPRCEQVCAQILRSKGYDEFVPLSKVSSTGHGIKLLTKPMPLFPGFLFCRLCGDVRGLNRDYAGRNPHCELWRGSEANQ